MNNFQQRGQTITLTAPSGGVVSGTGYKIGSLIVLATKSVAQGLPFPAFVKGVCAVAKVPDEVWTEGLKIYFDESEARFTLDPDTAANQLVGVAVEPIAAAVVITSDALAADLSIAGLVVTVLDFAALAGALVRVTVGGVTYELLEEDSGDWEAATGNTETADSLAAAINAILGVAAENAGAVITVVPGTGASSATPNTGALRLDGATR